MPTVVGVRFKPAGKIYYFDPAGLDLKRGQKLIVETARGLELCYVVIEPREVPEEKLVSPLKRVIRQATSEDVEKARENEVKAREAFKICEKKIAEKGLDMDLVSAEYTFDRSKVIFYFTADGRVDFRELVKDLASILKTRVEMRQIGVRDKAKILGGYGPCGRSLCCGLFLEEFEPVSIKMAKRQNLSLNPAKISGVCGRLMCCLRFESDAYEAEQDVFPEIGTSVITPDGEGVVESVNSAKKLVLVRLASGVAAEYSLAELEEKIEGE